MTHRRSALAILFVIVFVDLLGFGMVIPLMPLYAKHLGVSETWAGLLSTGYSAMQFLFAPIWGRLSDRLGRRPVLLGSIFMTALGFLVYGLAGSFAVLLASRLFAGAATANIAIARAFVADVTTPENRARGMGVIGAAFGLGFVLGPPMGGLLTAHVSPHAPGLVAAGLAALNGLAGFFVLPEPEERAVRAEASRHRFSAFLRELGLPGVRRLVAVYFLSILAFAAMENTFSFLATDRYRVPEDHVSYIFGFLGVVLVVVQGGLIGPLTRRFGEVKLLVVGMALQGAGLVAFPFVGSAAGLWVAMLPFATGVGLAGTSVSTLLSKLARVDEQGGTMGIGEAAAALGRVLGPLLGTFTYARWAQEFPYLAGGALMLLAAGIGSTLRRSAGGAAAPHTT